MEKKIYAKKCLRCDIIVQFNSASGKYCKPCAKIVANKQRNGYKKGKFKSPYLKKGNKPNKPTKKTKENDFSNDANYKERMI